jgi:hypothetical protein
VDEGFPYSVLRWLRLSRKKPARNAVVAECCLNMRFLRSCIIGATETMLNFTPQIRQIFGPVILMDQQIYTEPEMTPKTDEHQIAKPAFCSDVDAVLRARYNLQWRAASRRTAADSGLRAIL